MYSAYKLNKQGDKIQPMIFLLAILIPACASSIPEFLMMYSASKLNKQGDNIGVHQDDSLDVLLSQFGTSLLFHVCF